MRNPHNVGAIDIGSNGIRLLVGSLGKRVDRVASTHVAVRLGEDVFSRGYIRPINIRRSAAALNELRRLANKHNVDHLHVVATSAMREARNGRSVARGLANSARLPLRVITGREEARLVHLAVTHHVDLRSKTALLVDIGGGSVELSLSRGGKAVFSRSFPLGAVRLLHASRNAELENATLDRVISQFLREPRVRRCGRIDVVVGTGGNVECLAKLRTQIFGRKSQFKLRDSELRSLAKQLDRMSVAERVREMGLRLDRADVIVPAAMILRRVLRHTGVDRIEVPHVGLRHGLLLDIAAKRQRRRAA